MKRRLRIIPGQHLFVGEYAMSFLTGQRAYYNFLGWLEREEIKALRRMGISYYDEVEGTILARR